MNESRISHLLLQIFLLSYLIIKLSAVVLSYGSLRVLEFIVTSDYGSTLLLVLERVFPEVAPIISFAEYVIVFIFSLVAASILGQRAYAQKRDLTLGSTIALACCLWWLTFVFSLWLGRIPSVIETLGEWQPSVVIIVISITPLFFILYLPFLYGSFELDPRTNIGNTKLDLQFLVAYSHIYAGGMALILRLSGLIEIAVLFAIIIGNLSNSKMIKIDLESSMISLLSRFDSGLNGFTAGILSLTGVYLGAQSIFYLSAQLTVIYTVIVTPTEPPEHPIFIVAFVLSLLLVTAVPAWWFKRLNSAVNLRSILTLYAILVFQALSVFWLESFVSSPAGNAGVNLSNPVVFSVALAGLVTGYYILREIRSTPFLPWIFAILGTIILGSEFMNTGIMSDIGILGYCVASYWLPSLSRSGGQWFYQLCSILLDNRQ